jgi:hypothetical protein
VKGGEKRVGESERAIERAREEVSEGGILRECANSSHHILLALFMKSKTSNDR